MDKTTGSSTTEQDKPYKLEVNNYSESEFKRAWYKFGGSSSKAANKEDIPSWQDASLSDKERWKQWQKAKDRELAEASTLGYYTKVYKLNNGWVWFVGLFG